MELRVLKLDCRLSQTLSCRCGMLGAKYRLRGVCSFLFRLVCSRLAVVVNSNKDCEDAWRSGLQGVTEGTQGKLDTDSRLWLSVVWLVPSGSNADG